MKVVEGLGCKAIRVYKQEEMTPAIEQAEQLMAEFSVPVVIEVMLERVTNIAMGTEIDAINEFEELAEERRGRADRDRRGRCSTDCRGDNAHAQIRRQPHDALHRAALHATASRPPPRPASRRSSTCSPTPYDKKELAAALRDNGLTQVLHNLPAGDWDAGERGIACHPDRVDEFREGVGARDRLRHRARLPAGQLPGRASCRPASAPRTARQTLVDNLRFAAERAARRAGIRLLIEPINRFDIPGFYLTRTAQALALIDEVGSPNLFAAVRHLPRAAHGRRTRRHDAEAHRRASATSSWPTTPAAASRAPARSTTRGCSSTSMRSATPAGSAANTSRAPPPPKASAGATH